MPNKIARFELVSQLSWSAFSTVYKALDTESQQTVALKVVGLGNVKDRAALIKAVFEDSEKSKPLNSHNIAALYGVGDEGDQLLAATEYIQGNSVATTLARHDGFSIWDLQDIARQVCHALDHAQVHHAVHQSLEPAKIMVQWDGQVKVLGFGISSMNAQAMESAAAPEVLHYASPEQLRAEPCDHRSALFSLGAVLYEMATEQKAFPGDTAEQVRQAILESTPPLPVRLKGNINPALSDLIMKAISKSPDERHQSGLELVRDLEQCKSGPAKTASAAPTIQKMKARAAAAGTSTGIGSPAPEKTPASTSQSASPAKMTVSAASKPKFAVDPMMAEESPGSALAASFSEISELPPLKEIYTPPPGPPADPEPELAEPLPQVVLKRSQPDKPKLQVRETAQKAVTEISNTPPRLFLYAVIVAVVVIAAVITGITLHNYLEDRVPSEASTPTAAPTQQSAPTSTSPTATSAAAPVPAAQQQTETQQSPAPQAPAPSAAKQKRNRTKAPAAPAVVLAELTISSNPPGAQITFDGAAMCQSPCTLTNIAPGQHVVAASKAGYGPENRTITMSSGENSTVAIDLRQLAPHLSVASTPAGAAILLDGKDTGKLTPSVLALEKSGAHTLIVRRYGYLEETSSVNAEAGQTTNVNLNLKPLGNTDDIRAAGGSKLKKVFGKNSGPADMGIVSIKTDPKGAQIMVNNRVLDKTSPFDFYLNPGTYVIDISRSGYKSIHRVVNVQQQERVAIEVTLSPE